MAAHERFNFKTIEDLRGKIDALGVDIRLQEDLSPLKRQVTVGPFRTANSLGIHPMEGCDGVDGGKPSDLTIRRYDRFARGGAGVLWFEATAVVPEGCANPRQLQLHEGTVDDYARLLERIRKLSLGEFGAAGQPLIPVQLTHSGRYSRPFDKPRPVIAFHHPVLDKRLGLSEDYPVISDDELEALEDEFVVAARLAKRAGFHGVDIKAVHCYLAAELLAAHTRPGRYGGSFENRARFLTNIVDKVRQTVPDMLLTVRLNACDGSEYPYSWGMSQTVPGQVDMEEPIKLTRLLYEKGVRLLNVTLGNPYYNPHISRPFDQPPPGSPIPDEHPLEGTARLFGVARDIQQAVPEMVVMGTGYSWLRQFFPHAAAANIQNGWVRIVGLGRQSIAYPDFARDLLEKGTLDTRKLCTACSKCTVLMRCDSVTGCVTRDSDVYVPIYRKCSQNT